MCIRDRVSRRHAAPAQIRESRSACFRGARTRCGWSKGVAASIGCGTVLPDSLHPQSDQAAFKLPVGVCETRCDGLMMGANGWAGGRALGATDANVGGLR
eukprot:2011116-Rhodomonas_salina.1